VSRWANGAGTTRQVSAEPDRSGIDSFDWRVSIADVVGECSFSAFPGIDRTILLVEGRVMVLAIDGVECRLDPLAPVRFGGEADVRCSVPDGPTRDLNIMCRRGEWSTSVEVLDARKPVSVAPGSRMTMFLACFAGQWSLVEPAAHRLGPGDFLRVCGTAIVQAAEPVIAIRLARSRDARAFGVDDDGAAG
jgi:environmental stress-induced protein Ves